ncbi:MAG: hypothetical protein ACQKBV_01660 [Puniceicoccales bacterium]
MKLAAFHGIRALESVLGPAATRQFILPVAERVARKEAVHRASMSTTMESLPVPWNVEPSALLRERVSYHATRIVNFWPDRYQVPRWQSRFEFVGCETLREYCGSKQPVVLATLHAGRMHLVHLALRSLGVPASMLVNYPDRASSPVKRRTDYLSNHNEPPVVYPVDRLREALQGLRRGGALMVALDKASDQMKTVNFGSVSAHLSTGAIRMARTAGAVLCPALLVETAPWRFRVWVGHAIDPASPDALVALGAQFVDFLADYPAQGQLELLNCLSQA